MLPECGAAVKPVARPTVSRPGRESAWWRLASRLVTRARRLGDDSTAVPSWTRWVCAATSAMRGPESWARAPVSRRANAMHSRAIRQAAVLDGLGGPGANNTRAARSWQFLLFYGSPEIDMAPTIDSTCHFGPDKPYWAGFFREFWPPYPFSALEWRHDGAFIC